MPIKQKTSDIWAALFRKSWCSGCLVHLANDECTSVNPVWHAVMDNQAAWMRHSGAYKEIALFCLTSVLLSSPLVNCHSRSKGKRTRINTAPNITIAIFPMASIVCSHGRLRNEPCPACLLLICPCPSIVGAKGREQESKSCLPTL